MLRQLFVASCEFLNHINVIHYWGKPYNNGMHAVLVKVNEMLTLFNFS